MGLKKTILAAGLCAGFSVPAYASSQAECAIWLCLPGGFPSAGLCPAAHAAMLSRIAEFKPPLPAWGSCAAGSGPNVSVALGFDNYHPCPDGYRELHNYRPGRRYCAPARAVACLQGRDPAYNPQCDLSGVISARWREERCYVDVRIRQDDGTYYHHREWYRSRRCAY